MKYVVIGIDNNPKYTVYKRLVETMWEHFGWRVFWLNSGPEELLNENISAATFAQVSRLYAAAWPNIGDSDYLMTSDADMLPLSDYWNMRDDFTSYGRDLTDYHYPMCYMAGYAWQWKKLMGLDGMQPINAMNRDLKGRKISWVTDQDIATEKVNEYRKKNKLNLVARGTDVSNGYPVGRLDRSAWKFNPKAEYIDCHLPHDFLTNERSRRHVKELYSTLKSKYNLPLNIDELC